MSMDRRGKEQRRDRTETAQVIAMGLFGRRVEPASADHWGGPASRAA